MDSLFHTLQLLFNLFLSSTSFSNSDISQEKHFNFLSSQILFSSKYASHCSYHICWLVEKLFLSFIITFGEHQALTLPFTVIIIIQLIYFSSLDFFDQKSNFSNLT